MRKFTVLMLIMAICISPAMTRKVKYPNGDVERVAEYNNDGKILIDSAVIQESVSRWVYNKKGDVEYMESARRGDYHYSYEYDSKGNWIKKIWYSGYHDEDEGPEHDECNPVYIQERVIEYY